MSIELRRKKDTFDLSGTGWAFFLMLAEAYGWQPEGTAPPAKVAGRWTGAYDSSDGQLVKASDSANLTIALKKALADANRPAKEVEVARTLSEELEKAVGVPCPVDPPEDDGAFLRTLVAFCSGGEFRIF